jgi:uridine kinase
MADGRKLVSIRAVADQVVAARLKVPSHRALLVGISGIDGSGKGFLTAQLEKRLLELKRSIVALSADDWHNLPTTRFSSDNPAARFYEDALRLDQMFEQFVIPLREQRAIEILADCADAKATVYRKNQFCFRGIDIILLEGIFLFKPAYRDHFDMKVWIDCSFATALRRATARGQEGLSSAETKRAFETIYFPAQRLHLERDKPREHADVIFDNEDM